MISERSAATMRPTSAGSPPPRAFRRSTSPFIAHSRSRSVRALVNSPLAEWMQQLHPLRLQYELFSDANPMMAPVATLAEQVRKDRRPVAADNPFVAMQENVSRQIVAALDAWRDMSEALAERTFLAVYGLPTLQAAVGIDPAATRPLRKAPKSPLHRRAAAEPDRRAQVAHPGRRAARSRDPRAALCRHGAGRGRRAGVRGRAAHSPRAWRHSLAGLQDAGARAIQHAADRHGSRARRNSVDASARCEDSAQGVRPHQAGAGCARRILRGGHQEIG